MWYSSNSMNKVYIDEANKHLQALTDQHNILEIKLKEANEKLNAKDIEVKEIIQDMARRHQEHTKELTDKLVKAENKCRKLEMQLETKEMEISISDQKSKLMEEIIKYKPLLAKLTICLEQAEQYSQSNSNQRQYYTNNPVKFFSVYQASSCSKRIVIASLYLGSGIKEKSLVDAIFNSIKNNLNNKNFRVHLLFDATRGSRSVKDFEGNNSSSRSMCLPLLGNENTLSRIKVSFYHTPNLRWYLYKLLPEKWNEIIGLQHMKIYLFDDCLVISGANLSEDYFTNRQDRYVVFENSSLLCDFYEELVDIVGSRSYNMNSTNVLESPKIGCDPLSGNLDEYILDFNNAINTFISNQIIISQNQESTRSSELTRVYPLIQMGLYNIVQDQLALKNLFKSLSSDDNNRSSVFLASGYFNLDCDNENLLFEMAERNIPIEVLTASPEANGFFNAGGFMKYIPDVYTNVLTEFHIKSKNLPIKILEWKKSKWTFHAKGFWISKMMSDYSRTFVTLIGSTNYGRRSCFRDLECEILIETESESLQNNFMKEKDDIFCDGIEIDYTRTHRTVPFWIPWIVPIIKYFF